MNEQSTGGANYHHGDLPNALRHAAASVITEKGVGGFSLREVARRAGVSHAAPAHHFGDMTGLLTSLATEALTKLHHALAEAAQVDDPVERLTAIGRAYVRTGHEYPAHCAIAVRTDLIDHNDAGYQEAGMAAYGVLETCIADLADHHAPDLDVDSASRLCWSAMQGLLVLLPNMESMDAARERPTPSADALVERFTELMVDGFR